MNLKHQQSHFEDRRRALMQEAEAHRLSKTEAPAAGPVLAARVGDLLIAAGQALKERSGDLNTAPASQPRLARS